MTARNVPVEVVIMIAHGIRSMELPGGPDWIRELSGERYDIAATAATVSSREDQLAMLRQMLEDRFALRLHRDKREMPVYLLTRLGNGAEIGPSLRRAAKDCPPRESCEMGVSPGTLRARGAQWALVLQGIAAPLDRRMVDRTGLSGTFDVDLVYSRGLSADRADAPPDIFAALREQLGLSLQPGQAATDVVVIDSISQPTPN
jgi:uncharacterized protein (TIGR03435 family)